MDLNSFEISADNVWVIICRGLFPLIDGWLLKYRGERVSNLEVFIAFFPWKKSAKREGFLQYN